MPGQKAISLRRRRYLALSSPFTRRDTDEFVERTVERGFGLIADLSAGLADAHTRLLEQAACKLKTPACHVLHGGHLDIVGKAAGKDSTGQTNLLCQPVQCPLFGGPCMDEPQRHADMRVTKTRQPSPCTLGEALDMTANH